LQVKLVKRPEEKSHNDAALTELESAAVREPGNARFVYVYAVALHLTDKSDAAIAN